MSIEPNEPDPERYRKEPRLFPNQDVRVETGVIQFGDDWPGVFIRGDNALYFATVLEQFLNSDIADPLAKVVLKGLSDTLYGCEI